MLQSLNNRASEIVKKRKERSCERRKRRQAAKNKENFLEVLSLCKEEVMLKRNRFDNITDDKLMDCCIYELKAAEAKLNYCLALARRDKLVNDDYIADIFISESSSAV